MANYIYSNDYADVAALSTNSEDGNFPASNALDYTHPFRPYKATAVTTSEYLQLDLGSSPPTITAIILDNINVNDVDIKNAPNSDMTGSPAVDDTGITVSQDVRDGRYKLYHVPTSTMSERYLRITCGTTSTTDGEAGFSIGSVIVLTAATTLNEPFGYPFAVMPKTGVIRNENTVSGGREPVKMGNRTVQITLNQAIVPDSSGTDAQLFTLAGTFDESVPWVLYQNNSDTSQVYIVRRTADMTVTESGPAHFSLSSVTLEEVV